MYSARYSTLPLARSKQMPSLLVSSRSRGAHVAVGSPSYSYSTKNRALRLNSRLPDGNSSQGSAPKRMICIFERGPATPFLTRTCTPLYGGSGPHTSWCVATHASSAWTRQFDAQPRWATRSRWRLTLTRPMTSRTRPLPPFGPTKTPRCRKSRVSDRQLWPWRASGSHSAADGHVYPVASFA
jgi:hypothetical protein